MPRLRGRWCKSVIDSVHHCTLQLTADLIACQLLSRELLFALLSRSNNRAS